MGSTSDGWGPEAGGEEAPPLLMPAACSHDEAGAREHGGGLVGITDVAAGGPTVAAARDGTPHAPEFLWGDAQHATYAGGGGVFDQAAIAAQVP